MKHSSIVGGSTAKRVINCPGSVALCATMPAKGSSKYADEGTLLHNVIAEILTSDRPLLDYIGTTYADQVLTEELLTDKLLPALSALEEIDPNHTMQFAVETSVNFGQLMPKVFGSTDLIGRMGNKAIVLDWKFGNGLIVEAAENEQLMFYAAAAMRTEATLWAFKDVTEIECIIVQPPSIKRWTTTPDRVKAFERELTNAVRESAKPEATLKSGDHCRWCSAKPVCPQMTGAVERALKVKVSSLDAPAISAALKDADLLEGWITDLRALAFKIIESGGTVPDYKLVAKRAIRKWVDESKAADWLDGNGIIPFTEDILSPAQAEKALKEKKVALPSELIVAVSSGNTLAARSDPRPEVLQLAQHLAKLSLM